MSEVRLNLIDGERAIHGQVIDSLAAAAVAALSAEPETIEELELALARYVKPSENMCTFSTFRTEGNAVPHLIPSLPARPALTVDESLVDIDMVDLEPWDAGVVIIDLAARIVATKSGYPDPRNQGEVHYHEGTEATELTILYQLSNDWLFVDSPAEYQALCAARRAERAAKPPLDARSVLYGSALLEFIRDECLKAQQARAIKSIAEKSGNLELVGLKARDLEADLPENHEELQAEIEKEIATIHAAWLLTPREDLRGQTPRDILLEKREFLEFDLHTRELQWSLQGEGPPCLPSDSFAFRFAGFGTHECVVYYDLLRHLLRECRQRVTTAKSLDIEMEIARLEVSRRNWLGLPEQSYGDRIPSVITERERKRLPIALSASDMIIDEDCPLCRELGQEMSLNFTPGFWHLDGSHMDDDFVFSFSRTYEEWEAERRRWQEFKEEFDREWELNQLSGGTGTDQPLDLELPLLGEPLADRVQ